MMTGMQKDWKTSMLVTGGRQSQTKTGMWKALRHVLSRAGGHASRLVTSSRHPDTKPACR